MDPLMGVIMSILMASLEELRSSGSLGVLISLLNTHDRFMHLLVYHKASNWSYLTVYGYPSRDRNYMLWDEISGLRHDNDVYGYSSRNMNYMLLDEISGLRRDNGEWCIIGDFN